MLKVLKAIYGNVDVRTIVEKHIVNDKIKLSVSNNVFSDTLPLVEKKLELEIDNNGQIFNFILNENSTFIYPEERYCAENTLILTSCNRVSQVLFAIAVNKEIIKEDFNLVVVDCSTPEINNESAILMHKSDDPYNLINEYNIDSDYTKIESYVKTISKIKKFNIIHINPRLNKQNGEAVMTSLGLSAASLLGSKYAVKLTGVCNLKYDIFSKLSEYVGDNYVSTWYRTNFGKTISTRVFCCQPTELNNAILLSGPNIWVKDYDCIENRLERIIDSNIDKNNINKLPMTEVDIIVDEGVGRNDHRQILYNNLEKHGLLNSEDVWIKKFLIGEIWENNTINNRIDIINYLIRKNNYVDYLEIGVYSCDTLYNCIAKNKTGVDPNPHCRNNIIIKTSDDFFSELDNDIRYDIIFIDGMHEAEQVFRDVTNSLKHLRKNGSIILHDCNPPTEHHATPWEIVNSPSWKGGDWNGNVFSGFIDAVNTYNLKYFTVNIDWGCGVIYSVDDNLNLNVERKNIVPNWEFFNKNRESLLNLISTTDFIKI